MNTDQKFTKTANAPECLVDDQELFQGEDTTSTLRWTRETFKAFWRGVRMTARTHANIADNLNKNRQASWEQLGGTKDAYCKELSRQSFIQLMLDALARDYVLNPNGGLP